MAEFYVIRSNDREGVSRVCESPQEVEIFLVTLLKKVNPETVSIQITDDVSIIRGEDVRYVGIQTFRQMFHTSESYAQGYVKGRIDAFKDFQRLIAALAEDLKNDGAYASRHDLENAVNPFPHWDGLGL